MPNTTPIRRLQTSALGSPLPCARCMIRKTGGTPVRSCTYSAKPPSGPTTPTAAYRAPTSPRRRWCSATRRSAPRRVPRLLRGCRRSARPRRVGHPRPRGHGVVETAPPARPARPGSRRARLRAGDCRPVDQVSAESMRDTRAHARRAASSRARWTAARPAATPCRRRRAAGPGPGSEDVRRRRRRHRPTNTCGPLPTSTCSGARPCRSPLDASSWRSSNSGSASAHIATRPRIHIG